MASQHPTNDFTPKPADPARGVSGDAGEGAFSAFDADAQAEAPTTDDGDKIQRAIERRAAQQKLAVWCLEQLKKGETAVKISAKLKQRGTDLADIETVVSAAIEVHEQDVKREALERITAYYDVSKKEFLNKTSEGAWNNYTEGQYKRILKSQGVDGKPKRGQNVSDVDTAILQTQDRRSLAYAGALAGWPSGVHETPFGRLLVTKKPKLVEPAEGDWSNLKRFFESLLADDPLQLPTFYGWLKVGVHSLYTRTFRPGQAFVLAGERGCGKSLAQLLITELFGGRFARPYQYMAGKTEFNSDMFTAEHLAIEDDVPSSKLADRRAFGAKVKEVTANQGQRLHAKNRDAIILPVFWRMTVSVNDEPENLMILPPIDESLNDKIIITRTATAILPCDTTETENRDKCWKILTGEIPAFLFWLKSWEIPVELRSGRYGVREFHHPELMQTLADLSPEAKLEQLIDTALFSGEIILTWSGSASKLEQALTSHVNTGYEARRLLSFNTAAGVYLSRLATKRPERYQHERHHTGREWSIKPPSVTGVTGFLDLKSKKDKEYIPTTAGMPVTPDTHEPTPDQINMAFDLAADDYEADERWAIQHEGAA